MIIIVFSVLGVIARLLLRCSAVMKKVQCLITLTFIQKSEFAIKIMIVNTVQCYIVPC